MHCGQFGFLLKQLMLFKQNFAFLIFCFVVIVCYCHIVDYLICLKNKSNFQVICKHLTTEDFLSAVDDEECKNANSSIAMVRTNPTVMR